MKKYTLVKVTREKGTYLPGIARLVAAVPLVKREKTFSSRRRVREGEAGGVVSLISLSKDGQRELISDQK